MSAAKSARSRLSSWMTPAMAGFDVRYQFETLFGGGQGSERRQAIRATVLWLR